MTRFSPGAASAVLGVTGTNGKTSTAWMLAAGLEAAGRRTYMASTIGDRFDGATLPPAPSFDGLLERLDDLNRRGATGFVLECTSHALARGFAKRVRFDTAVFTNLTHEHVDQHQSWEHYLASKAQLFAQGLSEGGTAVLNAADEASLLLDEVIPATVTRSWYGACSRGPYLREPSLAVTSTELSPGGTHIVFEPGSVAERFGGVLGLHLLGDVFAENAVAAALALLAVGVDEATIHHAFSTMPVVPGRFEVLASSPLVVVDYAHTPDALVRTCATARRLAERGRVIVVFGAGGNRDTGKRVPMGVAVGLGSDIAIVTTDNPRNEDPCAIAKTLARAAEGVGKARVLIELDRRSAIELALSEARELDVVVVCGKGHERGQIVDGTTVPFSDVDVVRMLTGG